jgi:iron complex outermembrane receptor protein
VEGGVAGTVDVMTRHPLDFKEPLAFEASIQAVHATLAGKTDPQFSALVNWKNDASTFGVMLQGFSEKRSLRRDGQELLQWTQVSPTSPVATAHPDLANVWYPRLIGSSLFEQERERKGGLATVQFKPSRDFSAEATFFSSKLTASNYNRNFMTDMLGSGLISGGVSPDAYTVHNGTLTSASFANHGTTAARCATVSSMTSSVKAPTPSPTSWTWPSSTASTTTSVIRGQAGKTRGTGATPSQGVYEGDINNTGMSYQLNGLGNPATVKFLGGDQATFTGTILDWVFGLSPATTSDEETYAQIDAEYRVDLGPMNVIKFGLRGTDHDRSNFTVAQGPNWANTEPGTANTNPSLERYHLPRRLR